MRTLTRLALAVLAGLASVASGVPAQAANPGTPGSIAFVRDGDVYTLDIVGRVKRVTFDQHNSWPRWAPRRTRAARLAYIHDGDIWFADFLGGQSIYRTRLTRGAQAGGPSWSPDGNWLAYLDRGLLHRVRVGTDVAPTKHVSRITTRVGAPGRTGRHAAGRAAEAAVHANGVAWGPGRARADGFSPLRAATAVAWSPDGTMIAFPGGTCIGVYDDCLTVLDLDSNAETTIDAYGGGGQTHSGFATTPAWTADGSRLLWTSQEQNDDGTVPPTRIRSADPDGDAPDLLGLPGDALPAPAPMGDDVLVAAPHDGVTWVTLVHPDGSRDDLTRGTQPDWEAI